MHLGETGDCVAEVSSSETSTPKSKVLRSGIHWAERDSRAFLSQKAGLYPLKVIQGIAEK